MDIPELDDFLTTIERKIASLDTRRNIPLDTSNDAASDTGSRASDVRNLADIPAQPLRWLWPGWIPAGTLTILGGHVGDGKSTVIGAIAAALTAGCPLPDGAIVPPVNVLIVSTEDDFARVIRPRLDANNADPGRVFVLDRASSPARLRAIIERHDIGLVAIDPLASVVRRFDRAGEGELRGILQPLMDVITDTGVAVLGTMRIGRGGVARRPTQRLVDSSVVPSIARSVIMLAREDEPGPVTDRGRAILQVVKSNYAETPPPVMLDMVGDGAVQWLGPADAGIDELADASADRRLTTSERADAAEFLLEFLRDECVSANNVLDQATRFGFSEITIRRAKKDAGVVSCRESEFRRWMWCHPDVMKSDEDGPSGSGGGA